MSVEAAIRQSGFPRHVNESIGFQALPANSGPLRRFEFVSACEVLLADSPGSASIGDLHDLFDLLDPGCTGSVPLEKFAAVLRAHQRPSTKPGAPLWSELGIVGAPSTVKGRLKSALSGLRTWMLQHSLLFQDLIQVFGDANARIPWPEFGDLLIARVKPPWITKDRAKEIFDQLKVIAVANPSADMLNGPALPSHEIRIKDLIEAMLDAKPFAEDMARRALRVVFREAHHRKVDVKQQFLIEDTKRTGLVDRKQLKRILDAICPNCLAEADMWTIEGKFVANHLMRYDSFLQALESERCLYVEHVMKRALPKLRAQSEAFLASAIEIDKAEHGWITSAQLRKILSTPPLEIGLDNSPNVTELDDFIDMLARATSLDPEKFKYRKLVKNGSWIGPEVEECLKVICGTTKPKEYDDDGKKVPAPKQHLLAILFYKIAESSRKLGLSTERAFERLDRGGKGYLDSSDLQLAVLDVLGIEENHTNLGLKPDSVMRFAAFQERIDFDLQPLCEHIPEVFGSQKILVQDKFLKGFMEKGARKNLVTNWLYLLYPDGVPPNGIERSRCETFFATHRSPSGASAPVAAERDKLHSLALCAARRQLYEKKEKKLKLRTLVFEALGGKMPAWLHRAEISKMLYQNLPRDQAEEIMSAALKTSALYEPSKDELLEFGISDVTDAVRAETLFVCEEAYEEHILEVRFEKIKGLDVIRNAIKTQNRQLEIYFRYCCHGTEFTAETNRLDLNEILGAGNATSDLNFGAKHTFRISKKDSFLALFESTSNAIDVQAWGGVVGEPRRLLGVATLSAQILGKFLSDAISKTNSPETVLGSQKEWFLPFSGLAGTELSFSVLYSKQSPQSQLTPALPWSSAFTNSLTTSRRSPMPNEIPSDASGPAAVVPSPGSVRLEVQVRGVALHGSAFKNLLASCLEGCAMPAASHGAGLGVFVRFCLFPNSQSLQVAGGCGWIQSPVTMLPEELLTDSYSGEKKVFQATMDFVWHSPLLDAAEVVAALQQDKASMELWLRTACVPSSQSSWRVSGQLAADVRLAEAPLKLKNLLRASSPEEPQKLRLRTLRNVSIDPIVAFKADKKSNVLADLISSVSMDLPNGPSVVSWLVEPDQSEALVDYVVKLREIWLSKELVASLDQAERSAYYNASMGANTNRMRSGPQYFYAEFGQGGPNSLGRQHGGPASAGASTATLPYYRSAPVAAQADVSGWLRVPLESDARVVVPKCPALGISAATDVQIRRGDFHSMRVRVLQLMRGGGTRLAADVALQLPLGELKEGGNGSFFGTHVWRPLFHSTPDAPAMAIVGRALLSVEAEHPKDQVGAPQRTMQSLPQMPTGVFLPLYSSWKVPSDASPWPLEVILQNLIDAMHPELWSKLSELERHLGTKGAIPAEEFESAFAVTELGPELAFFRSALAVFFSPPVCTVPWLAILYWFALRAITTRILPVAPRLLQRLQQLDKTRGRLTGTVPLSTFQQVLFEELSTAPLPTEWVYLRELISQRPQWSVGANQFCGHEYFDYFAFFWDLNATGIGSVAAFGLPSPSGGQLYPPVQPHAPSFLAAPWQNIPRRSSVDFSVDQQSVYQEPPFAMLTIASAHHLLNVSPNHAPSAFVTYCWGDKDGLRQGDTIGNTEVIPRDSNPKWNHTANIVLPRIVQASLLVPYPDAFRHVELVLQVWGMNEWNGTQRLIGTAHVPLAPLRSGFAEVDGYYQIEATPDTIQVGQPSDQGQIRISLTPHWAPTPSASDRNKMQPLQYEPWALGSCDGPTSIFADQQVLNLGEIAAPSSSPREEIDLRGSPSLPMPRPSSPSITLTSRLPSHFASSVPSSIPIPPIPPSSPSIAVPSRLPSSFTSSIVRGIASHSEGFRPSPFEPIDAELQLVGHGPGVEDDVCTTALRFASGLSTIERQLRSLEGSEEVQLKALRERHLNNLAELDRLQQEKLQKLTNVPTESSSQHKVSLISCAPSQAAERRMNPSIAPPALGTISAGDVVLAPSRHIDSPALAQSSDLGATLQPFVQAEIVPLMTPLPPASNPIEPPTHAQYSDPGLNLRPSMQAGGMSQLTPLPPPPPPAEPPPDCSRQMPYGAQSVPSAPTASAHAGVSKGAWPTLGTTNLLPKSSFPVEPPAVAEETTTARFPSALQNRPTRFGSSLLPNYRPPSDTSDASEEDLEAMCKMTYPVEDNVTKVTTAEEAAVVQQLRDRIEALRRAEEDAAAQQISDDAVVLEILGDQDEDENVATQLFSAQTSSDQEALRQLIGMEMEGIDDDEVVRRLMEREMDVGVSEQEGVAEDELREGAFTFGLPRRSELPERLTDLDIARSREALLRRVGQDVLEDHHQISDNAI